MEKVCCVLLTVFIFCAAGMGLARGEVQDDSVGKTLVAYFSNTGNTQEAALELAKLTEADLAQIERTEAYPSDNDDFLKLAEQEIKENAKPDITVTLSEGQPLESLDEYDVIYVGYPIWWNEAPAMISSFLEKYDFGGKAIAPFCTSVSSAIDNSLHIFSELCPDAELYQGLRISGETRLEEWIQTIQSGVRQKTQL